MSKRASKTNENSRIRRVSTLICKDKQIERTERGRNVEDGTEWRMNRKNNNNNKYINLYSAINLDILHAEVYKIHKLK